MSMKIVRDGIVVTISCLLLLGPAFAEVPHLIRYQGQAVDSNRTPLEGPYDLTFRLYDAETAGTGVWEESWGNLQLTEGRFKLDTELPTEFADIDGDGLTDLRA